ncbi:alkaline phosphatase [Paenibacillus urinalis]|uniref:Alkaline phosphatase n=1 Tax=Paenibacillus urinalis TaxID=521520 RepID=A0AAX3MT47_9BACL|nr:alkaline phosphatase [Paenibacillus urinalis]WDH80720.1 alkaline phosphatase [Paenibacillus urinalis]WDH96773.1 alkaline phosphatase [Paenibacillus urinalis]
MNKLRKKVITISAVSAIALGTITAGSNLPILDAKGNQNNNRKVDNVIFMVPDGFSASYATNYRWYKGEETALDSILVGMHRTYSANSEITDSAAAGTAFATGVKTNNGMISTSPDGKELKTILEAMEEKGKSSGLVATSTITHATPAVFASHVASRSDESAIAPQLIDNDVDVIMGGGKKYFPDSLINEAKKDGYQYISSKGDLKRAERSDKLIGLFADSGMAPELDRETTNEPSLQEMTETALKVLNKDKDGFFLMVEGSQIDWAGHDHDAAWAMKDSEAFEKALESVLEFAKKDKNTLVVVAGDHDTGGMSVGGNGPGDVDLEVIRNVTATGDYMVTQLNSTRSNVKEVVKKYTTLELTDEEAQLIKSSEQPAITINEVVSARANIGWTSLNHTGVDVPLYAYGPGADLFIGLHENTDLPVLMAEALKIKFTPGE